MFNHLWKSFSQLSATEERIVHMLLRNQRWRDGVGYVHKTVQHAKEGKLPPKPNMGLENLEGGPISEFFRHFKDELRNQLKRK